MISRRAFATSTAFATFAPAAAQSQVQPAVALGVSRDNKAIHQEVTFKSSAARLYQVLTDPVLFDKVVLLSGAMKSMHVAAEPCRIDPVPGGAFSLFGGYINGRQIELTPGARLVQVWRSEGWAAHIYSVVRFELSDQRDGARLVFDHTGFPNDDAAGLATGWHHHYWEPIATVAGARHP
jgi:activator of HSP90 ATPase